MKSNGVLKVLTGLLLVACVVLIVQAVVQSFMEELSNPVPDDIVMPEGVAVPEVESTAPEGAIDLAASNPQLTRPADLKSRLNVGELGLTPELDQIPVITEVPWMDNQAGRAFNLARDHTCQMLTPEIAVSPRLARPNTGRRGAWGRIPALTISLEIQRDVKLALPIASRGAIDSYLRNHQLAIEPIIYQNEQGEVYFGMDARAAFYLISDPTKTVLPEPLIEQSMTQFRALGLLREKPEVRGRTMVMAFRFMKETKDTLAKTAIQQPITELLFFHLTAVDEGNIPSLEVFGTSDERQTLHRLYTSATVLRDSEATVTASIRFDKMTMMGLYPSNPIVTGYRNRSAGMMSRETVIRLTKTAAEADRMTFQQLLDQFTLITGENIKSTGEKTSGAK